jgi:hypothetical protein
VSYSTVRDRNPQGRAVLIGHSVKDQFQLLDTTMLVQAARDAYRFEVKVPAGQTAKETVTEERDVGSSILLTNSPDELREGHPTGQSARAARTS